METHGQEPRPIVNDPPDLPVAERWQLGRMEVDGIAGTVGAADHSAGSEMTKRAPRMSPGFPPGMFSAVSVPPCASMI